MSEENTELKTLQAAVVHAAAEGMNVEMEKVVEIADSMIRDSAAKTGDDIRPIAAGALVVLTFVMAEYPSLRRGLSTTLRALADSVDMEEEKQS